jgi:hypothetical protein
MVRPQSGVMRVETTTGTGDVKDLVIGTFGDFFGGAASILVVDGETGFLAKDDRELVTRAREVVEDPELRERLGEAAERRARTFSWDRSAATFLEVLRRTGGMPPESPAPPLPDAHAANGSDPEASPRVAEKR